jgi:hypothetical protein
VREYPRTHTTAASLDAIAPGVDDAGKVHAAAALDVSARNPATNIGLLGMIDGPGRGLASVAQRAENERTGIQRGKFFNSAGSAMIASPMFRSSLGRGR